MTTANLHPGSFLYQAQRLQDSSETLWQTIERIVLTEAMDACGGNQRRAGRLLGLTPRVMNHRLQRYELRPCDG